MNTIKIKSISFLEFLSHPEIKEEVDRITFPDKKDKCKPNVENLMKQIIGINEQFSFFICNDFDNNIFGKILKNKAASAYKDLFDYFYKKNKYSLEQILFDEQIYGNKSITEPFYDGKFLLLNYKASKYILLCIKILELFYGKNAKEFANFHFFFTRSDFEEDIENKDLDSYLNYLSNQKIYFGAPGTGKSYEVNQITKQYKDTVRTTFYPESDYSTFVGSYKPTTTSDGQIIYEFCPQVFIRAYVQAWSKLIHFIETKESNSNPNNDENQQDNSKLLVNDPSSSKPLDESQSNLNDYIIPQFLVIEEINRGNCAQIFGDLFQLLDRNDQGFSSYPIEANLDLQKYLAQEFERLKLNFDVLENLANQNNFDLNRLQNGEILYLPSNLYIYATMNTSDQSLFPIDSAFKRRWDWEYVPIAEGKDPKGEPLDYCIRIKNVQSEQNDQANNQTNILEYLYFDWWDFIQKINTRIQTLTNSEDKKLGYFFCKANRDGYIPANKFVGKVLFYLWNDVFKDFGLDPNICKAQDEKGENIELTFDKFYQIDQQNNQDEESKGINLKNVLTFLENLKVSPKEPKSSTSDKTIVDNQSQGLNREPELNNNSDDLTTNLNSADPPFMDNMSNM